ncbi:hypothetical protein [Chryseosolibacter indicus]|uniref:Uncharacterized protein n=1 Tax=Chryseosolibacter indicus TaxID=2782351 RepID=A0ABS5VWQ3_9BACT|nr:hypothetical protein [Chryseosolibacter indicus]MBT1705849.1 hypothetical protein [Chryseosolibacter indicus]
MEDINDDNDLEEVASYLTKHEADSLTQILYSQNIDFTNQGHDAANRYHSLYYLIKVRRGDLNAIKRLVNKKRAEAFIEGKKCPKCKNLGYKEIEKKGFWQRVYYLGTTLVQCNKCKTTFPV